VSGAGVRELRNDLELAVILGRGGTLDFDLPTAETALVPARRAARAAGDTKPEFLTEAELQQHERENLLIILKKPIGKSRVPTARLNYWESTPQRC
jgi:DNA-binding NtrC family response regulator